MITQKTQVHIDSLIVADLGQPPVRGQQPFWHCPFHDDRTPSLTITPDQLHWKCFGCGQSGDAIDWLRMRKGCSYREAVEQLGLEQQNDRQQSPQRRMSTGKRPDAVDPKWSDRIETHARTCTRTLLESADKRALVWLINRGLKRDTLLRWRVGYNAHDRSLSGLSIPLGITIPWLSDERVIAMNIRRPVGDPKYKMVKGSNRQGLYLDDAFEPGRMTLLVEGEFDALLAWQTVGNLVNVGTLGSATTRPDLKAIRLLVTSPRVLVAYDADQAGRSGAVHLAGLTKRTYRLPIPTGKDITEFHQRGGDVRMWIRQQLTAER